MSVSLPARPVVPVSWQEKTRHVFRAYWTLCKASFQDRMEYRWNTLMYLVLAMIPALISLYLWNVIYNTRHDQAGVRYITTYYVVATFIGWRIADFHWQVLFEIRDGKMATDLMRPMSYPAKLFWYEVGGRSWSTLLTIPFFVALAWLLGDNFQAPDNAAAWFLAIGAFMLAFTLNFFMTAGLGLVTVWQNQPEGFFGLWGALARGLGGAIVPLTLLPAGLHDWLQWLPFAYIYSLPVQIFQGLSGWSLWQGLLIQLGWLIVSALVFRWLWRKATRRYEVFEG